MKTKANMRTKANISVKAKRRLCHSERSPFMGGVEESRLCRSYLTSKRDSRKRERQSLDPFDFGCASAQDDRAANSGQGVNRAVNSGQDDRAANSGYSVASGRCA